MRKTSSSTPTPRRILTVAAVAASVLGVSACYVIPIDPRTGQPYPSTAVGRGVAIASGPDGSGPAAPRGSPLPAQCTGQQGWLTDGASRRQQRRTRHLQRA